MLMGRKKFLGAKLISEQLCSGLLCLGLLCSALLLSSCGGNGVDVGGDETVAVSIKAATELTDASGLIDEILVMEPVLRAVIGLIEADGTGYRAGDETFVREVTVAALALSGVGSVSGGLLEIDGKTAGDYAGAAFAELETLPDALTGETLYLEPYDVSALCGIEITDAAYDGDTVLAYVSAKKSDGSVSGIYIVTLTPNGDETSAFGYRVAACVLM